MSPTNLCHFFTVRCPHWPSVVKFKQLTELEKQLNLRVEVYSCKGKKNWKFWNVYKPGRWRDGRKKKQNGTLFVAAKVEKWVWVRKLVCQCSVIYFQGCFSSVGVKIPSTFKYPTKKSQDLFLEPDPFSARFTQSLRSYLKWNWCCTSGVASASNVSFQWKMSFSSGWENKNLIHTSESSDFVFKKQKMCGCCLSAIYKASNNKQKWELSHIPYPFRTFFSRWFSEVPVWWDMDSFILWRVSQARNVACSLAAIKSLFTSWTLELSWELLCWFFSWKVGWKLVENSILPSLSLGFCWCILPFTKFEISFE